MMQSLPFNYLGIPLGEKSKGGSSWGVPEFNQGQNGKIKKCYNF